MERRQLLSTYVVSDTNDDTNPNSLRWAILQSNATTSGSGVVIDFNIPAAGGLTIHLDSPLPAIDVPVMIDGTSESGYEGAPLVEIDGSGLAGAGNDGLVLTAGGSTVRGLSLVGFSDSAILLTSGGDNVVAGNDLGLTPAGAAIANLHGICLLGSSGNTIGVSTAGPGNVISGNSGDGVLIERGVGTDSSSNSILGNLIGTSPDGLHASPNKGAGIDVAGASGNLIGGPGKVFGNVVSANLGPGLSVVGDAAGTAIQGNLIGVGMDGQTPLGNQGDGIELDDAPGTTVGGSQLGQGNVIGANQANGIETADDTAGLLVMGNAVGTDATGVLDLGNQQNGICLGSSENSIGGTTAGAANVIEFNGSGRVGAGVQFVGAVVQNTILSNSIYANAGLGINFGSGPTPNHAPGTPGPNDYQNYPVLSLAQNDGATTTIDGSLAESPNTSYMIQFFASPQADPSGYGQGKLLIGAANALTDAQGNATFTTQLPPAAAPGYFVSATATDPAGNTSEFAGDVQVRGEIDLVLTGAATPDPVAAGSDLTYTLTVANAGTADAQGVTLSDQLPTPVTVVSATPSQGYIIPQMGKGMIEANLGTIPAGGSASLVIVVQTATTAVGTITDTASVSSQVTDPDPSSESTTIAATVETAADLSLTLAEGPSPALAGDELNYTMTVTNQGPQAASNAVASLLVPAGLAFVSVATSVGTASLADGQVVADLGDLPSGGQAVVTAVLQAVAVGSVTETASVTSESLDPDLSNNGATVTTRVNPAADLAVQVTADTGVAAQSIGFDYTITVTNIGPCDATSVALSDTLPSGVTLVSATTGSDVTPIVSNGVVSMTVDTLAAGASVILSLGVTTNASAGSTLADSATVQGTQADPDPANNSATLSIPVRGASDLSVTVAAQPGSGSADQPLTITVDVTNNGPADEPDAVLSGALPNDVTVDSTSSSQGGDPPVNQGILTADLGPLASGETAVVTLVITPGASDVGTLTTGFSVQGQDYDPDLANNADTLAIPVVASCDLEASLVPSSMPAVAQIDWSYSLVVTNQGPSAATGVVATLPLPAGVQLVSASSSQGGTPSEQSGAVTADLGAIAASGMATVTVIISPTPSVSGEMVFLTASVAGDEFDPYPSNNQATLNLSVAPSVAVALSMTSTPQTVESGQVLTVTASVKNEGSTQATGVIVDLPSIAGLTLVGSAPSQGNLALVSGQYFAHLGDLAPGASATVTVEELATNPGNYTLTATVAESEYNLDMLAASASASAVVVESPGIIQFGAAGVAVTDQSGAAVIPVMREFGAAGTVTVHYQTVAVNATPGVDFAPTSGTLTLGPGQWSGLVQVPVLDDPFKAQDQFVDVTLSDPTGGAILGPTSTAAVRIHIVDPDLTPPSVSGLTWSGSSRDITSLTLTFTAPLDPAYATDAADYHLAQLAGGQPIPIASIGYDPNRFAVTIVPAAPIPSRDYTQIQVVGAGPSAIRDLAGNLLDGVDNGVAGSDYTAAFAQGTRLKYQDGSRNIVTLNVKGAGYLEQVLDSSDNCTLLTLVGMVPHRTTLKGRIKALKGGSGHSPIGTIAGLGQFGQVKVLLKMPPFQVAQLPFQRRGRYVL